MNPFLLLWALKAKKNVGGQALIEGVMIKSPTHIGMAARTDKGKIVVQRQKHVSLTKKNKFYGLPIIRGIIYLFEMLITGFKALTWSAEQQGEEDEQLGPIAMTITVLFAIAVTVVIFIIAPYYLTKLFLTTPDFWFNLVDGVFRLAIFIVYIIIIGLMPDMFRTYQYHGAEHKAVYCYEANKKLTVKNVQKYRTMHPRCGTSLIVWVIAVSIILFSVIRFEQWYLNIPLRILIVPLIGGISYEMLKFSAKYQKNPIMNAMIQPGIWVQKITTQEPTDKQVQVAIAALKAAI